MKREIRDKTGYKNRDFIFKNYVWGISFYSEDNRKMVKDFVCFYQEVTRCTRGFPCSSVVKNLPANAGDVKTMDSVPGSGRFPGGGHGNSLQYSCLENPMGRRAGVLQSME